MDVTIRYLVFLKATQCLLLTRILSSAASQTVVPRRPSMAVAATFAHVLRSGERQVRGFTPVRRETRRAAYPAPSMLLLQSTSVVATLIMNSVTLSVTMLTLQAAHSTRYRQSTVPTAASYLRTSTSPAIVALTHSALIVRRWHMDRPLL